jgi:SpoIIAA-like
MLNHHLLRTRGLLIIRPEAPLEAADFHALAQEVDPYLQENGKLHGLMIDAESFPGWKDFASLVSHLRFVKNHHQKVEKIAVVTDGSYLSRAPRILSHFVQAEVKHFPRQRRGDALRWLSGEEEQAS